MGAIVVCDITNEESLKATLKWKEAVEENCCLEGNQKIPIMLVQNKTDLLERYGKLEEFMKKEYIEKFTKDH